MLDAVTEQRLAAINLIRYNASSKEAAYTFPNLDWWANGFATVGHVSLFDQRLFSAKNSSHSLFRVVDDLNTQFGGVDVVVLWATGMILGIDSRNQFDLLQDYPGSNTTIHAWTDMLRLFGWTVLLGYSGFDTGTAESLWSAPARAGAFSASLGFDGIYVDDDAVISIEFFESAIPASNGLGIASAGPFPVTDSDTNALQYTLFSRSIANDGAPTDQAQPPVGAWSFYELIEPRHRALQASPLVTNRTRAILAAHVHGGGFNLQEQCGAFVNAASPRDAALLMRSSRICRRFSSVLYPSPAGSSSSRAEAMYGREAAAAGFAFPAGTWLADYPTGAAALDMQHLNTSAAVAASAHAGVQVSRFVGPCAVADSNGVRVGWGKAHGVGGSGVTDVTNCTLWLVANYAPVSAVGVQLYIHNVSSLGSAAGFAGTVEATLHAYDLYGGTELDIAEEQGTVTLPDMEPNSISAVYATTQTLQQAGWLGAFLAESKSAYSSPLTPLSSAWPVPYQQWTPINRTPPAARPPPGMFVVFGSSRYHFATAYQLPTLFLNDSDPAAARLRASGGNGVQYPWMAAPTVSQSSIRTVQPFFMDSKLVTCKQFSEYLAASKFQPATTSAPQSFLRSWSFNPKTKTYTYPDGADQQPVVWVSRSEAQTFCQFYGKRLPMGWEWQFAAQGGNSSAVYPWGDVFEPSRVPEPDSSRSPRAPDNVGAHPTGAGRYGMQDAVGLVWQFTDRYCSDRQCFSVLKGGSYYTPVDAAGRSSAEADSMYYRQAYKTTAYNILPEMAPSATRSAMVGFRCVVDVPLRQ